MKLLRKVEDPRVWVVEGAASIQADTFSDVNTKKNILSVWSVGEDERDDIQLAVGTMAFRRNHWIDVSYLMIDDSRVRNIGLDIVPSDTVSPLRDAENKHYHIHVESAENLARLVEVIAQNSEDGFMDITQIGRYMKSQLDDGKITEEAEAEVSRKLALLPP